MKKKIKSILILKPLRFYTQNDEDLFFNWLKKIESVKEFKGIGRELHVTLKSLVISTKDLLDFMGIFDRYKFDINQLTIFKNKKNEEYFDNQKTS